MKIAVLGCTGMLGHKVFEVLRNIYGEHLVLGSTRRSVQEQEKGFFQLDALDLSFSTFPQGIDYVINCIGVIKPEIAKVGIPETVHINSLFPRMMSDYCKRNGIVFINITTDCVFSGERGEYTENYLHDATDIYGRSKSFGEPEDCMNLRTSIIGEEHGTQKSLIEWVKSQKGKEVSGFRNHFWNGITTKKYAEICSQIIDENLYQVGTFHIFSSLDISKYELLCLLNKKFVLGLKINPVDCDTKIDRTLRTVKDLNSTLDIPSIDELIQSL